jgi:predicted ATPase/transcriptional regulator with XRE-family HTH domain
MEAPTLLFGEFLRRCRERRGFSQEALAERTGLTAKAIGALERGERRRPYPHTLDLLATALGLTADERASLVLLARSAPPGPPPEPAPPPAPSMGADEAAPVAAAPPAPLPAPLTSLIGRDGERAAAAALLAGGTRLLTLTGPGGVGKTRLALAVAADLVAGYPDGAALVDLAPLHDPRLVPAAIARAVHLRESPGRSARELLLAWLRGRRMLLVLDSCEHVLGAAPFLSELLESCARLALLVTSRAPLRLRGELRFPVTPLSVPSEPINPELGARNPELGQADAVRLFVERARNIAPDFTLDADAAAAAAVAAICRRLDGLPLAIELAAARLGLLRPEALLRRLERRLPLLTGGAADLPERQQALHRTIAWSHDLIGPDAQALFRRLAVFRGGWTLEAAEAVCGVAEPTGGDVLDVLGVLVDNSLVRRLDAGQAEPRFDMLETVHEYAWERLEASTERPAVQRAHATYLLRLARPAHRGLMGPAHGEWLRRLEAELHNLRAALAWAVSAGEGEAEMALSLCAALTTFWYVKGYYREGRDWSARALAAAPEAAPATRAAALHGAATLADIQQDHTAARSEIEASVALRRSASDHRGLASSLALLGMIARHERDWTAARQACEEALAIYAESPEPFGQRRALSMLGWVAEDQGDRATACELLEASLAVARAGGSPIDIATQLTNLGIVAIRRGDDGEAARCHREALRLTREVDAGEPMSCALEGVAAVVATRGDHPRAAWLLGAAATLRAVNGTPRIAQFEEEYARLLPQVREALGEEACGATIAAGAAAPLDEVLAAALADDGGLHTPAPPAVGSSMPPNRPRGMLRPD